MMKTPSLLASALVSGFFTCLWSSASSGADVLPAAAESPRHTVAVTSENIDELLQGDVPVVIDFWAEWCGPCRIIAPFMDTLAEQYDGRVLIGKVDVDSEPGLAQRYGIRGIPNLKFFKGGKVVDEIVGLVPKDEIERHIKESLLDPES